jgi:hypothetical protein
MRLGNGEWVWVDNAPFGAPWGAGGGPPTCRFRRQGRPDSPGVGYKSEIGNQKPEARSPRGHQPCRMRRANLSEPKEQEPGVRSQAEGRKSKHCHVWPTLCCLESKPECALESIDLRLTLLSRIPPLLRICAVLGRTRGGKSQALCPVSLWLETNRLSC